MHAPETGEECQKPGTKQHEKRPSTTKRIYVTNESPARPIRNCAHDADETSH
jgi:hypothetical protein